MRELARRRRGASRSASHPPPKEGRRAGGPPAPRLGRGLAVVLAWLRHVRPWGYTDSRSA
eukprot:scaffold4433_cov124-Isochrysis_galbana.AAC.2